MMILVMAALLLAYAPLVWLVNTWRDPSYGSKGLFIFMGCLSLFVWSVSSRKIGGGTKSKTPLFLLLASALIRLVGQVLAINVIGALTLVMDVYALSKLSALDWRTRPLSPFWLAVCVGFSLPVERILQRTLGYALQHLSADGACFVLGGLFDTVKCQGVRILINTQDVLVDLPCSGARSFLLLLLFFCVCAAIGRFKVFPAVGGLCLTVLAAYLVNILRICLLAGGMAYPSFIGGLDVMAQPTHDIIGLVTLFLGCLPIIIWTRAFYRAPDMLAIPPTLQKDGWWLEERPRSKHKPLLALGFILMAFVIIRLPQQAIDVSKPDLEISLPQSLEGEFAEILPLTPQEEAYFTQYGGTAQKARYGAHNLLIVRTSAPLRHLHAPDECLRGLGMKVDYKGSQYSPLPTAIYKATDTQGTAYRIAVSFISPEENHITTNVAEAIWHWMQKPSQTWMAVQRISHWDTGEAELSGFDRAVMAALDINFKPVQLASLRNK